MAAGDLKGEEAIAIEVTLGDTVTKGQVIHLETDGYWDPGALADTGNKAVALKGGVVTDEIMAVVWGRVEVIADDTVIKEGATVGAGAAGDVSSNVTAGQAFATAMEAFAANAKGTIWVGLVR